MTLPVAFKAQFARFGHGALGQRGFFDRTVVRFDRAAEEVEVIFREP